jgi:kynurenine formamidase
MVYRGFLGEDEFAELANRVSNWGRWGKDDELGTVNHLTPEIRAQAAQLVTTGDVVSMSRTLHLGIPEVPQSVHLVWPVPDPVAAASEFIGVAFHGGSITHIDALNHIHAGDRMYNDFPTSELKPKSGSTHLTVEPLCTRLSGRGVLLDIAGVRGVDRLENEEAVTPEDLERAETTGNIRVGQGDLLFVRTGANLSEFTEGCPGLDAECAVWMHERKVAMLGSDVATDVMGKAPKAWNLPLHRLAIAHMGMPLIDNCDLTDLAAHCRSVNRIAFFCVVAPLRLVGSTGSPVTPLAFF